MKDAHISYQEEIESRDPQHGNIQMSLMLSLKESFCNVQKSKTARIISLFIVPSCYCVWARM